MGSRAPLMVAAELWQLENIHEGHFVYCRQKAQKSLKAGRVKPFELIPKIHVHRNKSLYFR